MQRKKAQKSSQKDKQIKGKKEKLYNRISNENKKRNKNQTDIKNYTKENK